MTLVADRPQVAGAKGRTHVLAIGVGSYRHLPGGADPQDAEVADGMEQLDSPPLSVRRIADWFLNVFDNPDRPLGTLRLLLSEDAGGQYDLPGGGPVAIDDASVSNIREEALALKALGDANPDDMLVFFFSGHGMASGARYALLASDYGRIAARPLLGAVSFDSFLVGMSSCRALHQVYFVDACRMASGVLLANTQETGDVLVPALPVRTRGLRQSVYYASLGGRPAYGQPGDISLFTRALLKSLRGPGASNGQGDWRVNTSRLQESLEHFASELADPVHGPAQSPESGIHTTFDFHFFRTVPPEIPLYVQPDWHQGERPPGDTAEITVSVAGRAVLSWSAPWARQGACSWSPDRFEAWLAPGREYTVTIRAPGGDTLGRACEYISPPFYLMRISRDG